MTHNTDFTNLDFKGDIESNCHFFVPYLSKVRISNLFNARRKLHPHLEAQ